MSKPAARIGDFHACPMVTPGTPPVPHVGGPITGPGVPTVLIGGMPAAVMGDMCTCVGPPDTIVLGSTGVLIGGKPAARMGDMCAHGGAIVGGCPTVLIGESSPGGPVSPVVMTALLNDLNAAVEQVAGPGSPVAEQAMQYARTTAAMQEAAASGGAVAVIGGAADQPSEEAAPPSSERAAGTENTPKAGGSSKTVGWLEAADSGLDKLSDTPYGGDGVNVALLAVRGYRLLPGEDAKQKAEILWLFTKSSLGSILKPNK